MKKTVATIGFLSVLLSGTIIFPTVAQNPQFPQTLPANTVVGRTGIGPGPAQAIPFSILSTIVPFTYPSGTVCPALNIYSPFVNTTGAPTGTTLNVFDGAQCVPWATLNQTGHLISLGSGSTNANIGGPGVSFPALIGQGAATTVTELVQPVAPVAGRAYAIAGQIQGNGSGGQKVGVYGAANNTGSNADDVWGGNFLAQWDATTPDVNVQGVEIDVNNLKSNTFSLTKAGLSINSGGTNVVGNAIAIASTTGSNRWNAGFVMSAWNTAGIVLGNPTTATGDISAKQPANNADSILLQRFTDAAPTGNFLRIVNAGNTQSLGIWDVSGNFITAGAITSGLVGGASSGSLSLAGVTSGSTTLTESATGGHTSFVSTSTPSITAGCTGAGSGITGTDLSGTVTGSTAAATTCTITFGTAFGAAPACVVTGLNSPLTGAVVIATNTLQVSFTSTANYKFNYFCPGV